MKMLNLAKRVKQISPSPTLGIAALAKKMQKEGIKVINFSAGEPDYDTPENIKEKAISAIQEGFTKYTPSSGTQELKEAICEKLYQDNLKYNPEEIVVSCGAKHSLFNAILTLCEEGDEVIIPSPYWVSYAEMVKIAGAKPVFLRTQMEQGFQIEIDELKKVVNKNTKLLIINSPNNPTGCVYEEELLYKIAKIVIERQIFVISDEIYEKLIYDGKKTKSLANMDEKIKDLTILINGVSKTYSMTGWRIGFCATHNKEVIKAISSLQDHSTSNPSSIAQKAAVEALLGSQNKVQQMQQEFNHRRLLIVQKLNKIEGIRCLKPAGAFYVFPNIKEILGKNYKGKIIENSLKLGEYLLQEAKVAVVPGSAFGADEYLRLSYATSQEDIEEGIDRIKEALGRLQ